MNTNHLLAERMAAGDMSAFQEFVEGHKKKVYCLSYDILGDHQDAEDVSQEVFIKVFKSFDTFNRNAKMSSWLHQIAVNACIDFIRRKKVRPSSQLESFDGIAGDSGAWGKSPGQDPELDASGHLLQKRIQDALDHISPKERVVFVMRQYNDFKIGEIAETLRVSTGTVKSLLFRALKKLRQELKPYVESPEWSER